MCLSGISDDNVLFLFDRHTENQNLFHKMFPSVEPIRKMVAHLAAADGELESRRHYAFSAYSFMSKMQSHKQEAFARSNV